MRFRPILLALIVFSVVFQTLAGGEGPPSEPILVIETKMHTASIKRIAVAPSDKYIVTASFDKTVRLWELSTGALVRTFRPPIDSKADGRVFALAVSPDGRTLACAGWMGFRWERSHSVYLFDIETGKLTKRIGGLPVAALQLAYSKDGRYLAVTLARGGIRIFGTPDYIQAASDTDYGSLCVGAEFDSKGRLVTASFDGFIRLYSSSFNLILKEQAKGGALPYTVGFSPDGAKIAVGFQDAPKVDVLSSDDLYLLYVPETGDITAGNLASVAWSSDGKSLYAGGVFAAGGTNFIRKWPDAGMGKPKDLPATDNTVTSIAAIASGGIAFGTAGPAFGIFDSNDELTFYKNSSIADYRAEQGAFLVSHGGEAVRFSYEFGETPALFSYEKKLILNSPEEKSLAHPITEAGGVKVAGWENTYFPELDGKPLELEPFEMSRTLAIAPDKKSFLLGADFTLRLYDRKGDMKWQVMTPEVTWAVNIAGNGKTAVAAFGDGTIRWYRISDGEELVCLFLSSDKKTWVISTPMGYYETSGEGKGLIGWHMNGAADKEAAFTASPEFFKRFHRPDVIAEVIKSGRTDGEILRAGAR